MILSRRRRGRGGGGLGALHARRPARRRRHAARLLVRAGRRADAALRAADDGSRLPARGQRCGTGTPSAPGATSPRSTTTSRSRFWKLAIILEGVFARYAAGQYGEDDEGYQQFAKVVERLAEGADQAERRLR